MNESQVKAIPAPTLTSQSVTKLIKPFSRTGRVYLPTRNILTSHHLSMCVCIHREVYSVNIILSKDGHTCRLATGLLYRHLLGDFHLLVGLCKSPGVRIVLDLQLCDLKEKRIRKENEVRAVPNNLSIYFGNQMKSVVNLRFCC